MMERLIQLIFKVLFVSQGKKINRVACGSAHTIAWSTSKPVNAGKLPQEIPMEYNHLQTIPLQALRNRLMLLHHFSDLFCTSLPQFDLQPPRKEDSAHGPLVGLDTLRGVLIPSGKVRQSTGCSSLDDDKNDKNNNIITLIRVIHSTNAVYQPTVGISWSYPFHSRTSCLTFEVQNLLLFHFCILIVAYYPCCVCVGGCIP